MIDNSAIVIAIVAVACVAVAVARHRWNDDRRLFKYDQRRHVPPLDRRPRRFPRWPNEGSSFARAQMAENMAFSDWQSRENRRESELSPATRKRLALRRKAFALVVEDRFFTGLPLV